MQVTDGRQLKAARAILGLTIRDMATAAGVNRNTVVRAEKLSPLPRSSHGADAIAETLEAMGICFETHHGKAWVSFSAPQERGPKPYNRVNRG